MELRKVVISAIFTLFFLPSWSWGQTYYLLPGEIYPLPGNDCSILFTAANGLATGSQQTYFQSLSCASTSSVTSNSGFAFAIYPIFRWPSDTSMGNPTVRVLERKIYFSITGAPTGTSTSRYVCFRHGYYRWTTGDSITAGGLLEETSNYSSSACVSIPDSAAAYTNYIATLRNSAFQVVGSLGLNCAPGGEDCPYGTYYNQIVRVPPNSLCYGSGQPLACCSGSQTGTCIDYAGSGNSNVLVHAVKLSIVGY